MIDILATVIVWLFQPKVLVAWILIALTITGIVVRVVPRLPPAPELEEDRR